MEEDQNTTPRSAVERALVSDRLDRVDAGMKMIGTLAMSSDSKLARLVEIGEAGERRAEAAQILREKEAQESKAWFRSLISRESLMALAAAAAGIGVGGGTVRSCMGPAGVTSPTGIEAGVPVNTGS